MSPHHYLAFCPGGIYLLDMIYIDSAYPASDSIIETEQRTNQMNNILRVISDLQMSCTYDHLVTLPHVQKYLMSVRYIEELQKFVEDDNFKLSLKIEPGNSSPRMATSKEDLAGPSELSLSVSMMWHFGVVESKSATFPIEKPRHLLDDSFLESQSPARNNPHSSSVSNGISIGSSQSSFCDDLSPGVESPSLAETSLAHGESGGVTMEGALKRKTLLKEGRKPKLASWTRYWITLCGSTLIFYGSKALRATERKHIPANLMSFE
ncbi:ras-specific guanine nucleotide-releasing factor 1 isoform X2 [Labeo rohita]|uniref:Ras-specific guanine nucleotide-releasing factor 1 isoform X2 n=1 Tax=Labeo rohita TaxID=84645 RepID=A0A498NI61_LABRO|nr:ras-specific guanine nucleotide-releasing factor 1 isoform X2 [Labeo rohita]